MSDSKSTSTWPPAGGLSTPTVSSRDTTLATSASIKIDAPAALVFSILLETASYPEWCTFVPRVTVVSQPDGVAADSTELHLGTRFVFHVIMNSAKPTSETDTPLVISDLSTPEQHSAYISPEALAADASYTSDLNTVYRVSWKGDGGFFSRGLHNERMNEVIVTGPESCEMRTWETMGGVLARTVKWMYKDTLTKKFGEWSADLKKISEEKHSAAKAQAG